MRIGKIVSSRAHLDYVCQVYNPGETPEPPASADHALGSFVRLAGDAVGLVWDTQLQNPDFGNFGPRLTSSPEEIRIFTPDLISEQATLLSVLVVGWLEQGRGAQGVHGSALPIHSEVELLAREDFRAFHHDAAGRLQLRYFPLVQQHAGPGAGSLLITVLGELGRELPEHARRFAVLRDALSYQRAVGMVGR